MHQVNFHVHHQKWNSEVASIAAYNVKQCQMKHDGCRKTQNNQYSGQNLYWSGYSGSSKPDMKNQIKGAIAKWFSESKDARQSDIDRFGSSNRYIGHFTQVSWAANTYIGCAISTYSGTPWNNVLIACNYGPGNMSGQQVYTSGPTASKCRARDNVFTALCTA